MRPRQTPLRGDGYPSTGWHTVVLEEDARKALLGTRHDPAAWRPPPLSRPPPPGVEEEEVRDGHTPPLMALPEAQSGTRCCSSTPPRRASQRTSVNDHRSHNAGTYAITFLTTSDWPSIWGWNAVLNRCLTPAHLN